MRFDYVTIVEALGGDAEPLRALDVSDVTPDTATLRRELRAQSWRRRNSSTSAASSSAEAISSIGPCMPGICCGRRVVQLLELADHRLVLLVGGDQRVEPAALDHHVTAQRRGVDHEIGGLAQTVEQATLAAG